MLTMEQHDIKHILWKVQGMRTQDMIDYLVQIVINKKESEFLKIANKEQPKTKEELQKILNQIIQRILIRFFRVTTKFIDNKEILYNKNESECGIDENGRRVEQDDR